LFDDKWIVPNKTLIIMPKASCIMPTSNRPNYIKLATSYFLNQSYRDAELIIMDDVNNSIEHLVPKHKRIKYFCMDSGILIGDKRNFACGKSSSEIIIHWDDDDYYGPDWIRKSIEAVEQSDADICGLNEILFYSPIQNKYWTYKDTTKPWLSGATMSYYKSFWESHPFRSIQVGEDHDYIWFNNATIYAHGYYEGFIAILHAHNTTVKPFENVQLNKKGRLWMDEVVNVWHSSPVENLFKLNDNI
jgi:glycosyltransferase involved in cell wall biosynthesis